MHTCARVALLFSEIFLTKAHILSSRAALFCLSQAQPLNSEACLDVLAKNLELLAEESKKPPEDDKPYLTTPAM